MDSFTRSYIETALWSSTDEHGEYLDKNYGVKDLAPETVQEMIEDCAAFQEANAQWITSDHCKTSDCTVRAGHDFWLTRCGHGAGYWDGDWSKEADKALTACSKAYGNVDLYVGDDGLIYST
jgi:hypothetical protein